MTKRQRRAQRARTVLVAVVIACLSSVSALAQPAPGFQLEVIVANLTNERREIDPGAKRLHKELKNQFRYEGIRVLEHEKLTVSGDEMWDMKLPNLRRLRIRPLVIEPDSALISVEVSGLVQSDLRIKKGQLVIIGAEKFGDGRLVIAIQAAE